MFKSKWSMILTYSGKLEHSAGSSLLPRASDKGCLHISTTVFCSINCLTFFPRIPETAQSHGFPPVMRGSSLCGMNRADPGHRLPIFYSYCYIWIEIVLFGQWLVQAKVSRQELKLLCDPLFKQPEINFTSRLC